MSKPVTITCPYCSGTEFQSGIVKQMGRSDSIEFAADQVDNTLPSWLESVLKSAGVGGVPTEARVCASCGHVALFVSKT